MSLDPNDFLFAGGSKSAKFEDVGDTIKGTVVTAEVAQQTDPDGNLKTWNDGSPVMQLIVTLQTDLKDDDDDDGTRRLYAKGGNFTAASGKGSSMLVAIREAVKKAGAKSLDAGGVLTVQHSGLGTKAKASFNAPKLYVAKYEPGAKSIDIDDI